MSGVYDGLISRHLNRRLSEPVARLLAKTQLTPNQATWGAFGLALLSFVSFAVGQNTVGGVLAQLSSVADGIDGGLARLKGMSSSFGGLLDSVLDRYADALIVLGMILWSLAQESYAGIWLVGFLAMVGTICVSYTRARIDPEYRLLFDKGLPSLASRDIRLFLIMLGSIVGQVYLCLLAIAVLTNVVVFYRLMYTYRCMGAESKGPESALSTPDMEGEEAIGTSN